MSMNHDYETGVALSDSVNETSVKRFPAEKYDDVIYVWQLNLVISKNHASQIKSYYGSVSESHGRSFRILHENVRYAPPGGGMAMTSYPVGNTTSSSQKPCMVAKKLLWISIRKSWSLFQNPS